MAAEDALVRSELGRAEQEVYDELLEEVDREAFEVRAPTNSRGRAASIEP